MIGHGIFGRSHLIWNRCVVQGNGLNKFLVSFFVSRGSMLL